MPWMAVAIMTSAEGWSQRRKEDATVFPEEAGASPTEEAKENDTCKMAAPRQTEAFLPEACHLGSMD